MAKRLLLTIAAWLALSMPASAQVWDQVGGGMQVRSGPTQPLVIIDQTNATANSKILSLRANGTEKCSVDIEGDFVCAGTYSFTAGQILAPDGSASAPSYSFTNAPTNGMYFIAATGPAISVGGSAKTFWNSTGIVVDALQLDVSNLDVIARREATGHFFQRNSTNAQRLSVANTYTSATNYEAFSVDWQSTANVARVGTRTGATGTTRELQLVSQAGVAGNAYSMISLNLTALPLLKQGYLSATLTNISDGSTGTYFNWGNVTNTATSGTVVNTSITPTYDQTSGNAANTDLLINRTETAVGSGAQLLIDAQRGGSSQFSVSRIGSVTAATGYNVASAGTYALAASFAVRNAPTIASGGCTFPAVTWSNGTAAFLLTIGTSCTGVKTLTLTLPAATNLWACDAHNNTSDAQQQTNYVTFRATSTTAVVMTSYDRVTGLQEDFTASDTYLVKCLGG